MGYEDLRAAIRPGGFYVHNLWHVTRLAYALSRDPEEKNAAAYLVLAKVAERVASSWDGAPVDEGHAHLVECHLEPKMTALLDAIESQLEPNILRAILGLAEAEKEAFSVAPGRNC